MRVPWATLLLHSRFGFCHELSVVNDEKRPADE